MLTRTESENVSHLRKKSAHRAKQITHANLDIANGTNVSKNLFNTVVTVSSLMSVHLVLEINNARLGNAGIIFVLMDHLKAWHDVPPRLQAQVLHPALLYLHR